MSSSVPNAPKFVLASKGNSHPFQERVVYLTEPQKVGRSVGRTKPASNNLIFDCKVLSRNHGIVWYEQGQFWVQDTKSANGTFVANQRLNKGSEESAPKEIFHEDLIQFGVDVVENQRNGVSVTHGCIIGVVYLYHPDGSEARPVSAAGGANQILFSSGLPIPTQDLYQLQKYLEEASHREQLLESKLAALQRLVADTRTCSAESWRALVEEDSLLTRLELLESQLVVFSKNLSDESLQKEITLLNQDKLKYAAAAKESVEKIVEEKQQIECKLSNVERCYSETEDECEHLRATSEETANRLQELATKHTELLEQVSTLKSKLSEAENARHEVSEAFSTEKQDLVKKIEVLSQSELHLNKRIAGLEQQLATVTAGTSLDEFENSEQDINTNSSHIDVVAAANEDDQDQVQVDKALLVNDQVEDLEAGNFKEQSIDDAIRLRGETVCGPAGSDAPGAFSSTSVHGEPALGQLSSATNEHLARVALVGSEDLCSNMDDMPLSDSGFNESEIILTALHSEIQTYSQQLESICQRLTDETRVELDTLRENMQRSMINVEDLKSSFEQKSKTVDSLEAQLSKARSVMHNRECEMMRTKAVLEDKECEMASKEVEIVALQEQLNSAKESVDGLKATVDRLTLQIEECHRDRQAECEQLHHKLLNAERALAEVRYAKLDRAQSSPLVEKLELSVREDESVSLSTADSPHTAPTEDIPSAVFHRTPVKFLEKLRRSEAEKERLRTQLDYVQLRLKQNQRQMDSVLASLNQSVASLRVSVQDSNDNQDQAKESDQLNSAVARLKEVSDELGALQSKRLSLALDQSNIVSSVSAVATANLSGHDDTILLLNKLPMFIIILAVICALFKFIFPD